MKRRNYWVAAEKDPEWDWDSTDHRSYPYGFTRRNKRTVQKILVGDYILRYWKGHAFIGILEVTETYSYSERRDEFPCKVECKCVAQLTEGASIPIRDIKHQFTFYNRIRNAPTTLGNYLMPSPKLWERADGRMVEKAIRKAAVNGAGKRILLDARRLQSPRKNLTHHSHAEDAIEKQVRRLSKAAGFEHDSKKRRAVELRAMKVVEEHLRNKGYTEIRDVHNRQPYDFTCKSAGKTLFVEVKGTKNLGEAITLTANEVEFAREHVTNMVLCVVNSIQVSGERTPKATGGKLSSPREKWSPDSRRLKPIAFRYKL